MYFSIHRLALVWKQNLLLSLNTTEFNSNIQLTLAQQHWRHTCLCYGISRSLAAHTILILIKFNLGQVRWSYRLQKLWDNLQNMFNKIINNIQWSMLIVPRPTFVLISVTVAFTMRRIRRSSAHLTLVSNIKAPPTRPNMYSNSLKRSTNLLKIHIPIPLKQL